MTSLLVIESLVHYLFSFQRQALPLTTYSDNTQQNNTSEKAAQSVGKQSSTTIQTHYPYHLRINK